MSDQEFFKYYVEQTNKRLDSIDEKVDVLISVRWQAKGMAIAFGALGGVIATSLGFLITIYYGR